MHSSPGGKATNLLRLQSLGFPVPPFRVVLPGEPIAPALDALQADFPHIARWAVRSSATAEDGAQFSFAGQFLSLLNVAPDGLAAAVEAVRASADSEAVKTYCALHGLVHLPEMAVVVQHMVRATASGVAFGINPVTGESGQPVINAVRGLGDRLVSGEAEHDPDALSPGQQQQVTEALLRAQAIWECPLDMEFAFEGDTLSIVQVRPVTAIRKREGIRRVWDNSNIVESYPGLTQPLTFSFILRMYEAVYAQLLTLFGVQEKVVNLHRKTVLGHMLGLIRGRVYYNLLSWYQALSLLPGYQLNASFMEGMMGVKERFEAEKLDSGGKLSGWLGMGRMLWRMSISLIRLPRHTRSFLAHLEQTKAAFRQTPLRRLSPDELLALYDDLEKTLVTRWKPPMVNDFFAMILFGVLQKWTEKLTPGQHLHNALLAGSRSVLSVAPATELGRIARALRADPPAREAFMALSPADAWQWLHTPEGAPWLPAIRAYLDAYGDRVSGELKLETRTWKQEPEHLIARLQGLAGSEHLGTDTDVETRSQVMRKEAEYQVFITLNSNPLKRFFFRKWLKATRYLVANRENLRLERTHAFDMVRQLMTEMGHRWAAHGLLESPEDIFFLKLDEIQGFVRGTHADIHPHRLVEIRRAAYGAFGQETLPERITTFGMVEAWTPEALPGTPPEQEENPDIRHGIGCCPGVVRGRARVVRDPASVQDLRGDILVSATTDPGWVALFPTCSAIVVERGSLLSHSAIVSRELGIPCVVAVPGLLAWLRDGDIIEIDGRTGRVSRS